MAEPSIATCALDPMIGIYTLTYTWQRVVPMNLTPLIDPSLLLRQRHRSIAAPHPAPVPEGTSWTSACPFS